jgi:hypothetical protein
LVYLAKVLSAPLAAFFPQIDFSRPVHDTVLRFIRNEKRGLVPVTNSSNPALPVTSGK